MYILTLSRRGGNNNFIFTPINIGEYIEYNVMWEGGYELIPIRQ